LGDTRVRFPSPAPEKNQALTGIPVRASFVAKNIIMIPLAVILIRRKKNARYLNSPNICLK